MAKEYQFHPLVQLAYLEVHEWLKTLHCAQGYMSKTPDLGNPGMLDVAAQFAYYFPAHYFKTSLVIRERLDHKALEAIAQSAGLLTIVDLGCGGGAASASIIAELLNLWESGGHERKIEVLCLGVDPNPNALGIYYKLMESLNSSPDANSINLETRVICKPIGECLSELTEWLNCALLRRDQPALPHVFLVQSNVVAPLGKLHSEQVDTQNALLRLSVPEEAFVQWPDFGAREASMYRQLFEQVPIDCQHMLTIGTTNCGIEQRVQSMGASIDSEFARYCPLALCKHIQYRVDFENPDGSYWRRERRCHSSCFWADFKRVGNTQLLGDYDWHHVIDIDNLRLAWARARALVTREVLYDEIEVKLFERNLDASLAKLRDELLSYSPRVARVNDRLDFIFVKNEKEGRPRVLARLEEEILSVAVIQMLGSTAFGLNERSYAYRPTIRTKRSSEYLYEYWFANYRSYTDDIEDCVKGLESCAILKTDIKSYFREIPQPSLLESVMKELRTHSERIKWLLKRILLVNLPDHPSATGLAQGSAGSGFYANAYLAGFDGLLGKQNEWNAKLFRFVDDIVLVVPDAQDALSVQQRTAEALAKLELTVNKEKTSCLTRADFLDLPRDRALLECLSKRFDKLTTSLWMTIAAKSCSRLSSEDWWIVIKEYQKHLRSTGVFVDAGRLSRKVHQYLSRRMRSHGEKRTWATHLCMPSLCPSEWALAFRRLNSTWFQELDTLRRDLQELVVQSHLDLSECRDAEQSRVYRTRIYFAANRLSRLGFGNKANMIAGILREEPWIIRQPQYVLRGLAMQGYGQQLASLFSHYDDHEALWAQSFLAVILRSVRELEVLSQDMIDRVVRVALDTRYVKVARLMATETWLLKLDCSHVEKHCSMLQGLLTQEENARLRKNYVLLLGKCKRDTIPDCKSGDPLMLNAHDLAHAGCIDDLLEEVEHATLRDQYYSGYYPDDESEFGEDIYP